MPGPFGPKDVRNIEKHVGGPRQLWTESAVRKEGKVDYLAVITRKVCGGGNRTPRGADPVRARQRPAHRPTARPRSSRRPPAAAPRANAHRLSRTATPRWTALTR